jgi:predicted small lipoprotein YifL
MRATRSSRGGARGPASVLAALLVGCGQKGPLVLPPATPTASAAPAAAASPAGLATSAPRTP